MGQLRIHTDTVSALAATQRTTCKLCVQRASSACNVQALCCVDDLCSEFVSGCYDGTVKIWNDGKMSAVVSAHQGIVKSVVFSKNHFIGTAGKDGLAKIWKLERFEGSTELSLKAVLRGHSRSVDSIDCNYAGTKFCTAGWDKTINLWDLASNDGSNDAASDEADAHATKRARTEGPNVDILIALQGHTQAVSAVKWFTPDRICSVSHDDTLRVWDLATQQAISNLYTNKTPLCLDFSQQNGLFLTGHTDNTVRLWDTRTTTGEMGKDKFSSHSV